MQNLFTLSHLTGEQSKTDRTAVIQGVEIRRRTLVVAGSAFIAVAPVATVLMIMWSAWAVVLFPVAVGLAHLFFNSHRRDGLRLRHWQHARDKHWSATSKDQFYLCFLPIDDRLDTFGQVVPSSEPVAQMSESRSRDGGDVDLSELV